MDRKFRKCFLKKDISEKNSILNFYKLDLEKFRTFFFSSKWIRTSENVYNHEKIRL